MIKNKIEKLCTVILPTFFPDDKILNNIKSIPNNIKIIVVDNSYHDALKIKLKDFNNCEYFNIGDVGLGKTFNFALKKVFTPYVLLTQPDVILRKDCIINLLDGFDRYPDAGMVVPIVYDNNIYSKYDFYDLRYSIVKKKFNNKMLKNLKVTHPSGDFCVDAVNATTMMIKVAALNKINGWDENYYVYLEDIDICLRLTLNNYSIIKIFNAKVDHFGWSSHYKELKDTMNISRIWHFTWSSLYFENKFCKKKIVLKKVFRIMIFSIIKNFFNLVLFRFKKFKNNFIKLSACIAFLMNKGSYFRVNHKIDD